VSIKGVEKVIAEYPRHYNAYVTQSLNRRASSQLALSMIKTVNTLVPNKDPFFSIVILCWNSKAYLQTCLGTLTRQSFNDFEVILVDNGSAEPVVEKDFAGFSELDLIFLSLVQNLGFAQGNNIAAQQARGKYLVLLNSDAFPQPDWLEEIYNAIKNYPNHILASRILMTDTPDKLDSEGDVYHISGIAWHRSYSQPAATIESPEGVVFSASGAAAVYPKVAFDQVGGFDDDFFAFYEDIDLGFRLRLAGFECIYVPTAVVHHVGSGSTGRRSKLAEYLNQRNMIWAYLKNMPVFPLIVLLPYHVLANSALVVNAAFHGRGAIYLKAKIDAVKSIKSVLKKRSIIQKSRKCKVTKIFTTMELNPIAPFISNRGKKYF